MLCYEECHATTIKYPRKIKQIPNDEKDVKVDLILFNNQLGDIFSCEDKPAVSKEADVQADIKKGKDLREKRLIYIKSILPHESLISSIEVASAQFYGLFLTIYGSRMTNQGAIIHYQKAVANLPIAFSPPEIAHSLLTVMSLQRAIGLDLKNLQQCTVAARYNGVRYYGFYDIAVDFRNFLHFTAKTPLSLLFNLTVRAIAFYRYIVIETS